MPRRQIQLVRGLSKSLGGRHPERTVDSRFRGNDETGKWLRRVGRVHILVQAAD